MNPIEKRIRDAGGVILREPLIGEDGKVNPKAASDLMRTLKGPRLLPGVMRFRGRDIVRVEMPDGPGGLPVQPFYRSTGRNSGMPGKWLPFDGICPGPWFDKTRFCKPESPKYLWRYGTEEHLKAGEMLDGLAIEEGKEATTDEINRWLGLYDDPDSRGPEGDPQEYGDN